MQKSGQADTSKVVGHKGDWSGGNSSYRSPVTAVIKKRTFNVTTYNNTKDSNGDYNSGSPFYCDKHYMDRVPSDGKVILRAGYPVPAYYGGVIDDSSDEYFSWVFSRTPDSYGPRAFSNAKDHIVGPSFDFLNAAYELKDLPDMLRQRFSKDLKAAGNYWLALKFGWEPLLRDVKTFVETQRMMQKRIAQLTRDNRRPVRRRGILLNWDYTQQTTYNGTDKQYPTFVTQCYVGQGRQDVQRKQLDKVWYSGRFRYVLPGGPKDVQWRKRMIARIYGLHPRPSVVYNAIPWSWLVDWFTNLGSIVNNLDSGVADRFIADYLYVMRHCEEYRTNIAVQRYVGTYPHKAQSATIHAATLCSGSFRKSRIKGNPFGFGQNENDLSLTQWSILGALGLSRL